MRSYKKLVRDLIPDIIKSNGEEPTTKILDDTEYKFELEKKLVEECNEVLGTKNSEERMEELADVVEVIRSLAGVEGKSFEDVLDIAKKKRDKRGGFEQKIFLEEVK